jgi:ParB family transcriptional regulator, chromosome partitioning protein
MDKPTRGLGSLIPPGRWEIPAESSTELEINLIQSNPYQPRLSLDNEQMQELVESVRAHGVIQPLAVRRIDGGYELIAGERRLTAARAAGLSRVPALVRECSDREMLELALVENIQREDINAIDRAKAYSRLKEEFALDQEAISDAVGKSRTSVANTLRLLSLPVPVQDLIVEGKLSEGHGRALIALGSQQAIQQSATHIIKKGLSVRETESLVKKLSTKGQAAPEHKEEIRDPNLADLESRLSITLGTKTKIHPGVTEKSRGYLQIEFYGLEDLNRLTGQLLGE